MPALHEILEAPGRSRGASSAVIEGNGGATKRSRSRFESCSRALVVNLSTAWGIGKGDRAGIYLRKSADGVCAMFGILKAGAAYVPVESLPGVSTPFLGPRGQEPILLRP